MCDSSVGVFRRGEGERIFNPEVVNVWHRVKRK